VTTLAVAQAISTPRDVVSNVRRHTVLASVAAAHGAQLVVFPELSLTSYDLGLRREDALDPADPRLTPLATLARARRMTIVAGGPVVVADGVAIGAFVFSPDAPPAVHTKQHLHPGEDVAFVPGSGGPTLAVADSVVGLAICADFTHPEHAAAAAASGATVYAAGALISEAGYGVDSASLRQAARVHGMLVLMANYGEPTGGWLSAGRSAIWRPDGTLLVEGPSRGEAVVLAHRDGGDWEGAVVGADAGLDEGPAVVWLDTQGPRT
jgi:predicted amidohydrolase